MVQRLWKFFHLEVGSIHKAAIILALSSAGSSVLALFRDRLLAGTFGAGKTLDIYYAAFKIPDFLYVFALTIASVTVLIPFFLERIPLSKEKASSFLNGIFTVFILAITALAVLIFFAMPYLAKMIAPGFSNSELSQMILLSRILLLSPILLGLSNLVSSVIQSFRRFFIRALSPILYNVGIIIGIVVFMPFWGMKGIAFGVVLGALMHLLIQMPGLAKLGFLPRISMNIDFSEIAQIIKFSLPRTLGVALNQIVLVFITAIASVLAAGSIAVFNLSYNLQAVPLGIIGISYSVAAFPTLTRLFVKNRMEEFLDRILSAARQIVFWALPASVLFIVLRAQIVRVIFGYGEFGWADTRLTAAGLAVFSISIAAQALVALFVRGFYAAGKTMKPVLINIFSSSFIVVGAFLSIKMFNSSEAMRSFFEIILRVEGVPGANVLMLPLVFSLGMILNAFLLCVFFKKDFGSLDNVLRRAFFQSLVSSLLIGITAYASLFVFGRIFNINTFFGILFQGLFSGAVGVAAGFCLLRLMKNKELGEITDSLKQKFWKTETIIPEQEDLS